MAPEDHQEPVEITDLPSSPSERGFAECPCTKTSCERRADCRACVANHARRGKLPFCER